MLYLLNHGPYGDERAIADLACEAEAAGWDGMFPLFNEWGQEQESVFAEAVAFVLEERKRLGLTEPFDVIKMGETPSDNSDEASVILDTARKAGATWWLEIIVPELFGISSSDPSAYEVISNRVMQGPPKTG